MFCRTCGNKLEENEKVCKICGTETEIPVAEIEVKFTPTSEEEAYRVAAKHYWYCFICPILFFIPILDKEKGKDIPSGIEVANNTLWLLILSIGISALKTIIASFYIPILPTILSLCSIAVSVFTLVAWIMALCGRGIKVPIFKDIEIIK